MCAEQEHIPHDEQASLDQADACAQHEHVDARMRDCNLGEDVHGCVEHCSGQAGGTVQQVGVRELGSQAAPQRVEGGNEEEKAGCRE